MTERNPRRGEIWLVNLDPTIGREIRKVRPAIVVSIDALSPTGLRIIVPITGYKDRHRKYPWCVPMEANGRSGLDKPSTADANQIKSASVERFVRKLGAGTSQTLSDVTSAVGICIDL
jgi:mRNA interferase MazF